MTDTVTETDCTDVEDVINQHKSEQRSRTRFAPREPGRYEIRILPPPVKGRYYVDFGMHFDINALSPKFGSRRAAGCVELAYNQECPFCAVVSQLFFDARVPNAPNAQQIEALAKTLSKKFRTVMNIIDVGNPNRGVLTWEVGRDVNSKIKPLFMDWGDLTNPQTGRDLVVTFAKQDRWNVVTSVVPSAQQKPITMENWREQRHNLDAYVAAAMMDVDEVKKALLAGHPSRFKSAFSEGITEHPDATEGESVQGGGADPDNLPGDGEELKASTEKAEAPIDPLTAMKKAGFDIDDPEVKKLLATVTKGK